jgi:hypothetical protein
MRQRIVIAVVAASFVFTARSSAQTRIEIDRVMSTEELASAGIGRLSVEERRVLELWLARYTATVAAAARTMPAQNAAPSGENVVRLSRFPVEGSRIARTFDGGSYVQLEDGTMWEVFLPDRPRADDWETGEFLRIERASVSVGGGEFSFTLFHGPDRDQASARFAGWVQQGTPSLPRRE